MNRCAALLLICLAFVLPGCTAPSTPTPETGITPVADGATPPAPVNPPGQPARPAAPIDPSKNRERETSSQLLAYPTGDIKTSVILLEKRFPAQARLGKPYVYELKVTNLKDWPLTGVLVREDFPASFTVQASETASAENRADAVPGRPRDAASRPTLESLSPPRSEGARDWRFITGVGYVNDVAGSWWATATRPERRGTIAREFLVGQLEPHQSRVIPVSGRSDELGKLDTKTTVNYTPVLAGGTDVINPILKLIKTAPQHADLCDTIELRYEISNVGVGTETEVQIEEPLPEGLLTVDGQKKVVSIPVGDLPAGQTKPFAVKVKASRTGQFTSRATARGAGTAAQSPEVATAVHAPKLAIALAGPVSEYVGKPAPFEAEIKNIGDAAARNASLSAAVDAGAAVFYPDGANAGPQMALGLIEAGQSRRVRVFAKPIAGGAMTVTVTARSDCADAASTSTRTTVLTIPSSSIEVANNDDLVRVGDKTFYRVTVRNAGSGADKNVVVVATLPEKLAFVNATGPTTAKTDGTKVFLGTLATLEPGQSAVWQIETKATEAGDIRFGVELTSESLKEPVVKTVSTKLY